MSQNHYLFTPRDLTRWCLGLMRYDLRSGSEGIALDDVLEVSIVIVDGYVGPELHETYLEYLFVFFLESFNVHELYAE